MSSGKWRQFCLGLNVLKPRHIFPRSCEHTKKLQSKLTPNIVAHLSNALSVHPKPSPTLYISPCTSMNQLPRQSNSAWQPIYSFRFFKSLSAAMNTSIYSFSHMSQMWVSMSERRIACDVHTKKRKSAEHDDVIKWKHFPRHWPFVRGIHRSRWIPRTKASDAELWCFLWSPPEWTIK